MSTDYHYTVMKRALELIETRGLHWSLDQIAHEIGLSSSHFQRVFTKWAGVSPKTYQQYLRLDYAKTRLASHHTILDSALDTGLSGSSRLHDLFIKWEAMSPGQYAAQGANLEIFWSRLSSPFGPVIAMATHRGLCGLGFCAKNDYQGENAFEDLSRRWPKAQYMHDASRVDPLVHMAFTHKGALRLHLIGSPFNVQVWQALLNIPSGFVSTYSDIATAIDRPKAQRAVGSAIGRNPISYFIPCHRALRKNGDLGGYHWGTATKRCILAYEGARHDAPLS